MRTYYLGQESLPVTHIFTGEEMGQFALEMASQLGEVEKLEMEKKVAMDGFKTQIDEARSAASRAAYKHRAGKETRYLLCHKCADYDQGKIIWRNPDTGEIVQDRVMTDEERQLPLLPRDEITPAEILHTAEMEAENAQ